MSVPLAVVVASAGVGAAPASFAASAAPGRAGLAGGVAVVWTGSPKVGLAAAPAVAPAGAVAGLAAGVSPAGMAGAVGTSVGPVAPLASALPCVPAAPGVAAGPVAA